MKIYFYILIFMLTFNLNASSLKNNGLLGSNYFSAGIGTIKFEDEDINKFYDKNIIIGLKGNFRLSNNTDLTLSISSFNSNIDYNGTTGDATANSISLLYLYHFLPNKNFDPYISIGLAKVFSEIDVTYSDGTNYKDSSSDNGYNISVGSQINIKNKVFITPSIIYSKIGKDEYSESTGLNINVDTRITKKLFIGGSILAEKDNSSENKDIDTTYFINVKILF